MKKMNWIDRIIRPSTRAFISEARRQKGYTFFDFLHGYFYARWPYLYIGVGTGEHPLYRRLKPLIDWIARVLFRPHPGAPANPGVSPEGQAFADTYHGKVVPLELARQLVTVKEDLRLPDLEQVIPYARARDLILLNPDHIAVIDCPCRSTRANPCLPLDVCLIVGEPFASFTVEHHPDRARWIRPEEAVEILKAEDARGHVHHAFLKDAMLGRFYAICNCCPCCCGAMQAHRGGTPMLASAGFISQADEEQCIACGACVEACPFGALEIQETHVQVDRTACMGCGICVSTCPQGALSLQREPSKGTPLEISALMEAAASRNV